MHADGYNDIHNYKYTQHYYYFMIKGRYTVQ